MNSVKGFRWLRKFTAVFIALEILLNALPWQDMQVHGAYDPDTFTVKEVTILKVYNADGTAEKRILSITGTNLMNAPVFMQTLTAGFQQLNNRTINTDGIQQFDLTKDQTGNTIYIDNSPIQINEGNMPTISSVTSKEVKLITGNIIINGTNLKQVKDGDTTLPTAVNISASYGQEGAYVKVTDETPFSNDTSVTIPAASGALGMQNFVFEKQETKDVDCNGRTVPNVSVYVKYTYRDQFKIIDDLIVDGLIMHPNRGQVGEKVIFEAPTPNLDNYDVFFLLNSTDPLTNAVKGKNKNFQENVKIGTVFKDVLMVDVPSGLIPSEYTVVLTNPVPDNGDPQRDVVRKLVLTDKFTVIDATKSAKIIDVQPDSGPDTGSKVTISGQYLITENIDEFVPAAGALTIAENDVLDPTQQLKLTYPAGGTYKGKAIIGNPTRTVTVNIGGYAGFLKNSQSQYDVTYSPGLDTLNVLTPAVTDAETNPKKDVVIETSTTITTADGTVVITERSAMKDGYTYIPSKLTPIITDVSPNKIKVYKDTNGDFKLPESIMVAIHGQNFMVNKFTKTDGTVVTRYPIIKIGPDIGLNKNKTPNPGYPAPYPATTPPEVFDIKVFDSNGNLLDGTTGNEIGTKILVTIPVQDAAGADFVIQNLGKTSVTVINPMRNSEEPGLQNTLPDCVEFVNPDAGKFPVITNVTPSIVNMAGGEAITINGSNFADGVKVFIDGEEVKNINRQGDGKKITFTCPKGREGDTQLMVMNTEGGSDIFYPFTYVKTYTNPKITDFSPKTGMTDTLVVITGDNFLKPDPTATEASILKLIGSRVLLENIEVNDYYIDPVTKKITLQDYSAPAGKEVLRPDTVNNKVIIENYYNSILLKDAATGHFYTLDVDSRGRIILSDGTGNDYIIEYSGGALKANKVNGSVYDLNVGQDKIIINPGASQIVLNIKTLYKIETINGENIITGNRVKVVDKNTIYFYVPNLEASAYYDVTVINPDTKKDSRIDQQGFLYYKPLENIPEISSVEPNEGSTDGGYSITIKGKNFEDNGVVKTRVYINGIQVVAQDTSVAVDGTSMIVKVPKYPGDLFKDKGTSRLTVPVVVVNPSNGATASKEDGFTYVVPGSHPQITKIVPSKGSAAGGEIVEITGMDFRFSEPFDDANGDHLWTPDEAFNDLNGNGTRDSSADLLDSRDEPILPKVFFGKNTAKIIEYATGYIKVVTPPGTAGNTEVYVLNNDAGMSNKVSYIYIASNPKITSILPNEGKKQGKDNVEIYGESFIPSTISVYNSVVDAVYGNQAEDKTMPLVRFGAISNRGIPREQENSGRIDNGRTTVRLAGGLTVEYDANAKSVKLTIEDRGTYTYTIAGYDGTAKFIPVGLLLNNGTAYAGYEYIKVEVFDRRLFVDRGYSPNVQFINANQLVVATPSYYTVGTVPVTVENPDGGKAASQFTYTNPAVDPTINNITKDGQTSAPETRNINGTDTQVRVIKVNYKGGSIISVFGTNFQENAKIQISNVATILPKDITYNLPGRLTFEMPAVPESAIGKLHRVLVVNEDGGSAMSDEAAPYPVYILFTKGETAPAIEKITPDKGPATGGTVVTIEGKDFREYVDGYTGKLSVYIGETKIGEAGDGKVTFIDFKTIKVIMPAGAPGAVKLRVENPDSEISNPSGNFTYLSTPKIIAVVDPADPTENARIKVISVEGGQEIKLKGSGFQDGARVVFNPVVKKVEDGTDAKGEIIYINGIAYLLESGTNGTGVKYIDGETLTVKTPAGKIDTFGILVINPDKGASDVFEDLKYGLPELTIPTGVHAELVYDRYIKINWNAVTGAKEYEIYVVINDNTTELIGSTEYTSLMYSELEPYTRYKFIVKAVGDYGPSKPSEISNSVKTGSKVGPTDDDGSLNEKTRMEISGTTANITIGEKDFDDRPITIDLTKGVLAGSREVVLSLPASVVASSSAKDITILGKDFRIRLNPRAFYSSKVEENRKKKDAGVRFTVSPSTTTTDLKNDEGTSLSNQYVLEADIYIGKDYTRMEYLNSDIEITMDFDASKAQMRKLEDISANRYDGYDSGWTSLKKVSGENTAVTFTTDRLGRYMVIGRRR